MRGIGVRLGAHRLLLLAKAAYIEGVAIGDIGDGGRLDLGRGRVQQAKQSQQS
jgi:hypothetical protein